MRPITTIRALVLVCMFMGGTAFAQPAAPTKPEVPTMDDIRAAYSAGDHKLVLQLIRDAVAKQKKPKKGEDASSDLDMLEVNTMKGESSLRVGDRPGAKKAFEDAAVQAMTPDEKMSARGVLVLLAHTTGANFMPKGTKEGGMDIIDGERRKEAMRTLWQEISDDLKPKADKSLQGKAPAKGIDLFAPLAELRALEFAGTRSTTKTDEMFDPLNKRALDALQQDLRTAEEELTRLTELASQATAEMQGSKVVDTNLRGLRGGERDQATGVGKQLQKLAKAASGVNQTLDKFGLNGPGWMEIEQRSNTLLPQVETILKIRPGQDVE